MAVSGLILILILSSVGVQGSSDTCSAAGDPSCEQSTSGKTAMSRPKTDLFLIGKTGHGKSSVGNSILGREVFQVSDSSDSETDSVQVAWVRRKGRVIKVVDGPGLCETRLDRVAAAEKMVEDMSEGIAQSPRGFHALVLVLKYGGRFTEEELSVVATLKSVFGENFVRDYCIVVFTHGINFDLNNKRSKISFNEWLQKRTGALKTLLQEINYRAVLFYKDDEPKEDIQLDQLISLVDSLSSKGKRYTNHLFEKVAKEREKYIVRENAPYLKEAIQEKIDFIMDGINRIKDATEFNADIKSQINLLNKDANDLEVEIAVQDKGTGVLGSLRQQVTQIKHILKSHDIALQIKDNNEQRSRELEELKNQYEHQYRKLEKETRKRNWWEKIADVVIKVLKNIF